VSGRDGRIQISWPGGKRGPRVAVACAILQVNVMAILAPFEHHPHTQSGLAVYFFQKIERMNSRLLGRVDLLDVVAAKI
jgi:hypothetical protein